MSDLTKIKSLAELARDQCEAMAASADVGDFAGTVVHLNSALNNLSAARLDMQRMKEEDRGNR